ncbi:flagellar hook-basal body complex protein FliE [Rhizobium sp. L1K21]|uniref:flagellar hook-basal body complex protein FliE n=1 Tax=Rhizobium sp. L1K21 TaxID=2954933 RepID=UPI0020935C4B|nr:flagellar hook-basal body complex protein FliE [Rhizobium sp. L1K21]MCO6187126.1 flagellar hook-basal body complex protein FliE [Rhizobium sp. L1K21]
MVDAVTSLASMGFTRSVGDDFKITNPAEENKVAGGPTFGDVLKEAAMNTVKDVKGAENASYQGIMGNMSNREVVDAVMAGERSLKTAIALRDKLVSAYLDITKMPI